jgi:hypothetical protein
MECPHVAEADISVDHQQPNVRLVGFNAPETRRAQCNAERQLGGCDAHVRHMPPREGGAAVAGNAGVHAWVQRDASHYQRPKT